MEVSGAEDSDTRTGKWVHWRQSTPSSVEIHPRRLQGPWDGGYALDVHKISFVMTGHNAYGHQTLIAAEKRTLVYFAPTRDFHVLANEADLQALLARCRKSDLDLAARGLGLKAPLT
jgi:hypothetical protein